MSRRSSCLAATDGGYAALIRLVTAFYLGEAGRAEPVPLDALAAASAGLIALTGGHDGPLYPLAAAGDLALAESRLVALQKAFGDRLYVALERHGMEVEREAEAGVVDLAYRLRTAARRHQRALLSQAARISRRMTRCSPSRRGGSSPPTTGGG